MKVQAKVSSNVIVTTEADKQTTLFEQLASLQEVFGQEKCGKCGCTNLQFSVREDADENKYYELKCTNLQCRAVLAFGQRKKGGALFPRRKQSDDDGEKKYLPDNGWMRYNAKTKQKE